MHGHGCRWIKKAHVLNKNSSATSSTFRILERPFIAQFFRKIFQTIKLESKASEIIKNFGGTSKVKSSTENFRTHIKKRNFFPWHFVHDTNSLTPLKRAKSTRKMRIVWSRKTALIRRKKKYKFSSTRCLISSWYENQYQKRKIE